MIGVPGKAGRAGRIGARPRHGRSVAGRATCLPCSSCSLSLIFLPPALGLVPFTGTRGFGQDTVRARASWSRLFTLRVLLS